MDADTLAHATEAAEAEAWLDLMTAMPPATRSALGAGVSEVAGGIVSSAKVLPLVIFNRAFGFGMTAPLDGEALGLIRDRMQAESHPVAQMQLAPFAWAGREAAIRDAGFLESGVVWAKMSRPSAARPGDLTVPEIETTVAEVGGEQVFAATVVAGYGLPPAMLPWLAALVGRPGWRCVLARIGGRPVAGAALYLARGGNAWLGAAATLPEARGRGAQKALILFRLALADAAGYPQAHSETGVLPGRNPSLSNLTACGFQLVHHRRNWTLAG